MSEAPSDDPAVADITAFLGFDAADAAWIARVRPTVLGAGAHVVARFYDLLARHPAAARILEGPAQIARLRQSLARWLEELFTGPWDAAYAASRRRAGLVHVRIRLPQRYVIGAMQLIHREIRELVAPTLPDATERAAALTAIGRLLSLDLALIVEAYQAEREEEASRAYQAIVRNTSDVVLTARPSGHVLYANRGCAVVPLERLLADGVQALGDRQTPESRTRFERAWAAAAQGNQGSENVPVEHVDPTGGQRRHLLVTLLPDAGSDGGTPLVHAVIRDVTDLRRLEADVEEQRRLGAVGEMVAGVAHEVRNPLQNVLLGLRRVADATDDARRADALAQARDGAEQIERLVNDLLSFSKRLRLSTTVLDAAELLHNALESCADAFAAHGAAVPAIPPTAAPLRLAADPFRMPQVLRNLIENALEAGGRVAVAVEPAGDDHVDLVVADDGPGLPDEVRARLFEPFVTTKAGGTGLGLAIARRLVEAHGGRLLFEDRPGGGTVARVRMPRIAGG
jgi:signal transduction histidine kinase